MIDVKYGLLPEQNFCNYFDFLIGKTYKILPLKEKNSETLKAYLESYQIELLGSRELVEVLANEPQFITVLNTMQYLIGAEYSVETCKKEVFKCIGILKQINKKYFTERE